VRALVGGFDFTRQQFNHATQAWRQPGSSFKPFLYSAALEHGVQPATVVNDAPWPVGADGWNPQNDDGQFDGPISLRRALAKSKNLVSIRLVQYIGVDTARQWAGRFGFDVNRQPDNLTLALGRQHHADAAGHRLRRAGQRRLQGGPGGDRAHHRRPGPGGLPGPAAGAADRGPAHHPGAQRLRDRQPAQRGAQRHGRPAQAALKRPDIYGKTGTTNDAVDAWFAGFQPRWWRWCGWATTTRAAWAAAKAAAAPRCRSGSATWTGCCATCRCTARAARGRAAGQRRVVLQRVRRGRLRDADRAGRCGGRGLRRVWAERPRHRRAPAPPPATPEPAPTQETSTWPYALGEQQPQIDDSAWVADSAQVIGNVELAEEVSVWFGAILRGDQLEPIRVGPRSNLQDACVLHSDPGKPLTLGAGVTVGHQAMLHGCTVGDNTLIGIGAVVLNGAKIGANCLVGAGALVTEGKEFPDGSLIVGSPAVVKRALTPEQIAGLARSATHYVANARRFREGSGASTEPQAGSIGWMGCRR
jgi:carbonic anhydrase/acetyltransferase-like protein (isoleucine patch superfamily)